MTIRPTLVIRTVAVAAVTTTLGAGLAACGSGSDAASHTTTSASHQDASANDVAAPVAPTSAKDFSREPRCAYHLACAR